MTQKLEKRVAERSLAEKISRMVTVRLVVALLVVCLGGTAVTLLGMRILFGTTLNEPTSIEVQLDVPAQVAINEPFAVTIQVTNLITTSQTLHSIDLDSDYLKNVTLQGSTPAYQTVQRLPLTGFNSYAFATELPAFDTTAVVLQFMGQTVGHFSGLIDLCLDDGNLCLALPLETTIIE